MLEGVDGCSVRKICDTASMAVGLINYHFGTLNDLLAAAYLDLAFSLMDEAILKSQNTALPRQRLSIFIKETFSDSVMQRKILRAWVVFWGMIDRAPQIKDAHDASNQAFRVFLEQSFSELDKAHTVKPTPRLAAIGLTAIIDGLWLEWCLSSETFSADEAVLLCEHWVDAACEKVLSDAVAQT
jgi:AcrR family transcriptional regulator